MQHPRPRWRRSPPHHPPNKVMIWDDHQSRCIGELSFRSEVKSVRLRRDRIIVVLESKIFMYNFADLKLVDRLRWCRTRRGFVPCCSSRGVCWGQKGQDGRLIATTSTKGTLVRIFSVVDGTLLQEVRRGADQAEIYSLAFSENMQWLAVSSDKGTVHVFSLKVNLGLTGNDKPRPAPDPNLGLTGNDKPSPAPDPNIPAASSSLSFIKGALPKYLIQNGRLHNSGCMKAFSTWLLLSSEEYYRHSGDGWKFLQMRI